MQRQPVVQEKADESMLSSAYRAGLRLNKFGFWLRASCLLALLAVALSSPGYRLHTLWLVPGFVGLFLAGLEHPEMYTKLLPATGWAEALKRYFKRVKEVPTISLSGVTEGLGMICAALLVAGPAPIRTSPAAHGVAVVAMLAVVWNVLSQTLLDTGWYNRDFPAPSAMIAFRWSAPAIAALIGTALLWWPTAQSLSISSAMVGGGSFLLLWPCIGLVDTLHQCGRNATATSITGAFEMAATEQSALLHKVKNYLKARVANVPDGVEYADQTRRITNDLLGYFALEWKRATVDTDEVTAEEIWQACLMAERLHQASGSDELQAVGARLRFLDDTDHCGFEQSAGELVRSLVMDLATNALDAGASEVIVQITVKPISSRRHEVVVTVDDNAGGHFPDSYKPGSSLATLQGQCTARLGLLRHTPHADREGTLVIATLRTKIIPLSSKPIRPDPIQQPNTPTEVAKA